MRKILIVYATREGQTAKIAARFAEDLRAHGCHATLHDARGPRVALDGAAAVVLAASVHVGSHEKEMVKFVRAHREELARLPTVFISVSLSEAEVEDPTHSESDRARATDEVRQVAEAFFKKTEFQPTHFFPVAGRLAYLEYNWFIRLILKRIAAAHHQSTDTTRDHEYTDWAALDAMAERFAREVSEGEPPPAG
jgi:menaquinone-dependent protoporphyrinogen oxidase